MQAVLVLIVVFRGESQPSGPSGLLLFHFPTKRVVCFGPRLVLSLFLSPLQTDKRSRRESYFKSITSIFCVVSFQHSILLTTNSNIQGFFFFSFLFSFSLFLTRSKTLLGQTSHSHKQVSLFFPVSYQLWSLQQRWRRLNHSLPSTTRSNSFQIY